MIIMTFWAIQGILKIVFLPYGRYGTIRITSSATSVINYLKHLHLFWETFGQRKAPRSGHRRDPLGNGETSMMMRLSVIVAPQLWHKPLKEFNFKYKLQSTKTSYRRLIFTLFDEDSKSFGCGKFYRDRSYHSNVMTSFLCLLMVDFVEI